MPVKSIRKRPFVKDQERAGGPLLGYARISKGDEQNNTLQTKALRGAGCRRLFEEAASGGRWDRPELRRMLDQLREGDMVVVWKTRPAVALAEGRAAHHGADRGAGRRGLTENIDTKMPAGRIIMQIVVSFAKFERAMNPGTHLRNHGR